MKIKGNKKDNELIGTAEDDTIRGKGGNDTIIAKGGHDTVFGGEGNDVIRVATNTRATIDAGAGSDTVVLTARARSSDISLGKGADVVDIAAAKKSGQQFVIDGGKGTDRVNFALGQDQYEVTGGDGAYTVVDANGNTYTLTSIESLTFNGIPFVPEASPVNNAPVLATPIADISVQELSSFSYQIPADAFVDPDNDPLTISVTLADGSPLPSWLSFDPTTLTISGTAPQNANLSLRITASDGSAQVSDVFDLTVTEIPAPTVANGVLYLASNYDYDVTEFVNGLLRVQFAGKTFTYDGAAIHTIQTTGSKSVDVDTRNWTNRDFVGDVNFTNVTFREADEAGKFEASFELGGFNVQGQATVNGNLGDYFRAAWDYYDDRYNPSTSYYDEEFNHATIELGIKYALYLANGGAPLWDIAKFEADTNNNGIPQRAQFLHDNLLGNFDEVTIKDRFDRNLSGYDDLYSADEIFQWIKSFGLEDYIGDTSISTDGRGTFNGNESAINSAAHNQVRVFDYAHGINRPDYIVTKLNASVDPFAVNGTEMYYGDGNSPLNWSLVRHEGAGIETALKIHYRSGYDIPVHYVDADGVHIVYAPEGHQVKGVGGASADDDRRAAWSFDYAITTGLNGTGKTVDDFEFRLLIDIDRTEDVNFVTLTLGGSNGNTPFFYDDNGTPIPILGTQGSSDDGNSPYIAQDSGNFGFDFFRYAIGGGSATPYDFSKGIFDFKLEAATRSGDLLTDLHFRIVVDNDLV